MDVISKIAGKFVQDVSAIHQMVPGSSTYTVYYSDPSSKYVSTSTLLLPSDVMLKATADALVYKGLITGASIGDTSPGTDMPASNRGWTWKIGKAGWIVNVKVEVGDMVICNTTTTTSTSSSTNFDFIQSNLDPTLYSLKGHVHKVETSTVSTENGGHTPTGTISTLVVGADTTFTGENTPEGTVAGTYSTVSTSHSHSFTGTAATIELSYDKSAAVTDAASTTSIVVPSHTYTPEGTVTNEYTTTDVSIKTGGTLTQDAHSHSFTGTQATISVTYKKSDLETGSAGGDITVNKHEYTPEGTVLTTVSYTDTDVTDTTHSLTADAHSHSFTGETTTFTGLNTPAGTVSIPTITVTPSTTSFNYATGAVADIAYTTKSEEFTSYDSFVTTTTFDSTTEELTFVTSSVHTTVSYDKTSGITLTTASSGTIMTDATATSSQPTFTGTEATYTVSGTPLGSTGDSTASVSGTIGAKYQKTNLNPLSAFTGTLSTLSHDSFNIAHTHSIGLTDTAISTTYTPAGTLDNATPQITDTRVWQYERTNTNPAFAGTTATISHEETSIAHTHGITLTTTTISTSYTPAGTLDDKTVSVSGDITATFTGTETTYSVSGTPLIASATSTFYGDAVAAHSHTSTISVNSGADTTNPTEE